MDKPASKSCVLRQPGRERILPEVKSAELIALPHHVLAENNLYTEEDIRIDADVYSLKSTNHLPFLPPNSFGIHNSGMVNWDPVSTLVHEKQHWNKRTSHIVKSSGKKYLKTYEELFPEPGKGSLTMPKQMADFLEIVQQDPDSEFDGITNWYYSGGRLSCIKIDGQNVLLSSCGSKNENLYMIPVENDVELGWHPVLSASSKLELQESCIHQIVGKSNNSSGIIGIRRRNTCTLYELTPDEGCFQLDGMHSTKSNSIYTSMDISEEDRGRYCTAGVGRQVTLWDSVKNMSLSSHIIKKPKYDLQIPWSSVFFVKHTFSLLLSDTCSLNFLDTRVAFEKPALTFYPRDSPHVLFPCDDISLVFPSSTSENAIYIATNHHLYQYDPRIVGIVKRWSHLLQSPPLYSQTIMENIDREWICIANQEPAEVEVIVNGLPDGSDFDNLTFPFMLPTLVESLHENNVNGQLLNPRAQQRLRASVTGIVLLPTSKPDSLQVLTQTSLGDIFSQVVTRAELGERDSTALLSNWESQVVNLNKIPQMFTTDKKDLSNLFEDLHDQKLKLPPYNPNVHLPDSVRLSKSALLKYKDKLAPELLAVWKIEDQPDWDADQEESDNDWQDESFASTSHVRPEKLLRLISEPSPSLFTTNLTPDMPSKGKTSNFFDQASQSTPSLLRVVSNSKKRTPASSAKRKANVSGF